MLRLAWATDLHFDHAPNDALHTFCVEVTAAAPDALLLAGDIGEAASVCTLLREVVAAVPCPTYAVLGNHDFYCSAIADVRLAVGGVAAALPAFHYLPRERVIALSETTGLVGHDGWGDARHGTVSFSRVWLPDFDAIHDLAHLGSQDRVAVLRSLGDEAAAHFRAVLPDALERFQRMIVLTHVPPFPEAARYDGQPTTPEFLPFFVCGAVGDVLLKAMQTRPDREMLVLCGHTHTSPQTSRFCPTSA